MIIVKITILAILLTIILIYLFKTWEVNHINKSLAGDFPLWSYLIPKMVWIDILGILASAIYILFFYW